MLLSVQCRCTLICCPRHSVEDSHSFVYPLNAAYFLERLQLVVVLAFGGSPPLFCVLEFGFGRGQTRVDP